MTKNGKVTKITPAPDPVRIRFGGGQLISPVPFVGGAAVLPSGQSQDGKAWVILTIESAVGSNAFLIPPQVAEEMGQILINTAHQANSGLIIP